MLALNDTVRLLDKFVCMFDHCNIVRSSTKNSLQLSLLKTGGDGRVLMPRLSRLQNEGVTPLCFSLRLVNRRDGPRGKEDVY